MRTTIPATTIVIVICLSLQALINGWRFDRANEERMRQLSAHCGAAPTTQPTTQPAEPDATESIGPDVLIDPRRASDTHQD
ncbi:MAG: hypothetical protein WBD40_10795 [Tepidisphaeraceae bacterium]